MIMTLICSFCDGHGEMEDPVKICPDCKGRGKVRSTMIPPPAPPVFGPMAAAAAIPMMQPILKKEESVTVNLGGGTKVSIKLEDIRKQLQRDLFASAGIQGSLLDRRI